MDATTDARLRHVSASGDVQDDDHSQSSDEALHDEETAEANVVGAFPLHGRRERRDLSLALERLHLAVPGQDAGDHAVAARTTIPEVAGQN